MPVSADDTSLYIVEEATYGVIPATPAWEPLGFVSESLATNANTTISNTITPNRQVIDSILNSMDISGSIEVELARTPAMDLVIESSLASEWDVSGAPAWKLSVESAMKSYSIMKRWPDPANAGQFLYQLYAGCVTDTLSITMTAGAEVTASIGIIGSTVDADLATVEPVGSTYNTLTAFEVLRAPDVKSIVLDNEADTLAPTLTDSCVTDITYNSVGNLRGVQCLGFFGNKDTQLGRFENTNDMTIFFSSNNIMEEFLNQSYLDLTFTIGDEATVNFYKFTIPRGKLSSETVVAGGAGQDVVNAITLQGLVDTTLTPQTTVIIETTAYV